MPACMRAYCPVQPGRTVYNCGIMGGRRAVLLGALERMAYRIGDHYDELEARQIRPRMIVDMLAMHEMILEVATSTSGLTTPL